MKRKLIIQFVCVISLFIILSGCEKKANITTINIDVRNIEADSLYCYITKNGLSVYPLWQWTNIALDSNMKAVIEIKNTELNGILLYPNMENIRKRAFLFFLPGEEISVTFDLLDTILVTIEGKYEKGLQLLTDFENNRMSRHETDKDYFYLIYSDTVPESILNHFETHKEIKLDKLEQVYMSKGIDKVRYQAIEDYITLSHLDELFSLISQKSRKKKVDTLEYYNNAIVYPVNNKRSDFQKMYTQLFNEYPYNHEYFKLHDHYSNYLYYYLWFKSLDDSLSMSDSSEELIIAEKYLDPILFELYFATGFGKVSLREPFEAIEMRYETFKSRYPESKFLPGIEHSIPKLRRIYNRYYPSDVSSDELNLNEEVVLVEDYKEIESLDQIIDRFKGKVIYIDFWASWCGPCFGEFEYASQVHEFADENNIVLLYISTDKKESNWIRALNTYQLSGYHARMVTDAFRSDLTKYEVYGIPRYMIVNKDGLIIEAEANRPSSGEELYNQLLQYVK